MEEENRATYIIAVYGDVLDKRGFTRAENANRSADIRLSKTLRTLTQMETKSGREYKKEKEQMMAAMGRMKRLQLQRKRELLDAWHVTSTDKLPPVSHANTCPTKTDPHPQQNEDHVNEERQHTAKGVAHSLPTIRREKSDFICHNSRRHCLLRNANNAASTSRIFSIQNHCELSQSDSPESSLVLHRARSMPLLLPKLGTMRPKSTKTMCSGAGSNFCCKTPNTQTALPPNATHQNKRQSFSVFDPYVQQNPGSRHLHHDQEQLSDINRGSEIMKPKTSPYRGIPVNNLLKRGWSFVNGEWLPPERSQLVASFHQDVTEVEQKVEQFLKKTAC